MKVFISHSHKDNTLAEKVARTLKAAGMDTWYDKWEIMPGENWAEKMAKGLRESNAMVVLISPDSLESEKVRMDIDYALSQITFKNRLIPVLIGNQGNFPSYKVPWIFKHLRTVHLPENGDNEAELQQIAEVLKDQV